MRRQPAPNFARSSMNRNRLPGGCNQAVGPDLRNGLEVSVTHVRPRFKARSKLRNGRRRAGRYVQRDGGYYMRGGANSGKARGPIYAAT
jgi:hypothetical protein